MRIVVKILLIPFALISILLSVVIQALGSIFNIGVRLLAGLFILGFLATLVGGAMNHNINTQLLINCGAIAVVLTTAAILVESIPTAFSRFSGWVWSL